MGKKIDATVSDAKLTKIATATTLVFCSTEPANFAAIAALTLLTKTVTGTLTPFTTSSTNRRLTIPAQTGMTATASSGANGAAGTSVNCTYCCLHDGTTLLMGTTVPTFSVTAGQSYNSNAVNYDDSLIPT
jgi:hypothetical protein